MRLLEIELSAEENRLLKAYRQKHDLELQAFIDMSDADREVLFCRMREVCRVPVTEPGYFYHGTSADRLPSIRRHGLLPQDEGRWGGTAMGPEHSRGRVFFSSNLDRAEWYAGRWSSRPVLLRVRSDMISSFEVDPHEEDSIFISGVVPASAIEVWSRGRWSRL